MGQADRNGSISRSRPIVVSGPWPGWTTVSSGLASATLASEAWISSNEPPGRSVRPIEPANSRSPEKNRCAGQRREPLGVTGAQSTENSSPASLRASPSASSRTSAGLGPLEPAQDRRVGRDADRAVRVGQHRSVGRMDQGRYVARAAHGRHGPDVIDMTMAEQDGDRVEPVLARTRRAGGPRRTQGR